jgi:hypothetical protein
MTKNVSFLVPKRNFRCFPPPSLAQPIIEMFGEKYVRSLAPGSIPGKIEFGE